LCARSVMSVRSSSRLSPTMGFPLSTPMMASWTPASLACAESSSASGKATSRGRPWTKTVDSSPTTADPVTRRWTLTIA